jgi:hypothetical protein
MHNKFIQTAGFLGILILSNIPAKSVQRFSMPEDTFSLYSDNIKVPTRFKGLTWRGVEYEPLPNRRAKGWLEWNVSPDNTPGPAPIYGEKVSLIAHTDHDNRHYSLFGIPYTKMETGHPKDYVFTAQLLLSGNPECVVLYWDNSLGGLAAKSKEDYFKPKQSPVQKEIKAVEEWVDSLTPKEAEAANLIYAERGDANCQVSVALKYVIEKNEEQAIYWFRKAAAQGNKAALEALRKRGITL